MSLLLQTLDQILDVREGALQRSIDFHSLLDADGSPNLPEVVAPKRLIFDFARCQRQRHLSVNGQGSPDAVPDAAIP
jgi:hypothetical protein